MRPTFETHRACPRLQFSEKPLTGQHSSERNEDVPAETLHPTIFDSAEAVVRRLPPPENPEASVHRSSRNSFSYRSNRILRIGHRATVRLPPEAALLHCRIVDASSRAPPLAGSPMQQITVRVPASTSNLGPGFDCLGVALRICNDVTVARRPSRQQSSSANCFRRGGAVFQAIATACVSLFLFGYRKHSAVARLG